MDNMSPQQQQLDHKRRMKSQSYRRQSAPSLVITKALTRSKTLSRETFPVPVCPETCPLVQSFLSAPCRSFLLHAHAQLKRGMQTQDRHLFLFTDVLVLAKAKSANHFKQKAQASVCEMWTAGCMEEVCEGSTSPERSFVLGWPTCNCVATFSSAEQKEMWLSLLKSRIRDEKEKEQPKTIPLRVYGKGINTFAVTKTLPVSNSDSTNEVIRLALQQFGIIGNIKDYQLWVLSRRDNTPYPLIGHEFPFSIQMSHLRQSRPHEGGPGGGSGATDRQVEHMQVYKHCQFILRPRPAGPQQHNMQTDFNQKTLKRRRSLIAWAFWRGSASHLNELSLAGVTQGTLFGRPLSSVCFEGALPKPVMDMLAFLYHEGAWTRGIFRRPAGARAVRELRDSLDAGETHLPLTRDHVFIIAGVFKEFLRSIPGSLLCCELHEEWMDVPEEDDEEEEQVKDVQRMIYRLPKDNALLLRHLLAVLHGIRHNAHENQMTSFNLSVCIAPSMLWPPGAPCSPEVEGEGTKKVCELVKFMIEHCQQILGEDPCSLFGGPPQRVDSEETETGPWVYPLTDSSYDSLENELDNSSGCSPTFTSRRCLQPKPLRGSLDSILTFSDDQDGDARHVGTSVIGLHPLPSQSDIVETSTTLNSLSLEGCHRPRRRSEPAIAYLSKFQVYTSSSTDGLAGDDEDEVKPSTHPGPRGPTRRVRDKTTVFEASSSSLSSTPASPTYTCSSLDSLDSHDQTQAAKQSLHLTKPFLPPPEHHNCLSKDSPSKEGINWGPLKGCRGLHPNSWLKKDRRLSLTQQEHLDKEEGRESGAGSSSIASVTPGRPATEKAATKTISRSRLKLSGKTGGGGSRAKGRHGQERQDSPSPPSHHRSTGNLFSKTSWFQSSESPQTTVCVSGVQQVSPPFYKPSGPSLSLFKPQKSHSLEKEEEECNTWLRYRRGSEPGRQLVDRVAASLSRERLPSDPGLKVSEADSQAAQSEARFCVSPSATKAVRDYFSSHPHSHPQSSQQVALALVEGRREWLRRCSDPTVEPDFDQLLFSEESYV